MAGVVPAAWKLESFRQSEAAAASQPEPMESVEPAVAQPREHRETVTSIGTVLPTCSVTLRNELAGTVEEVALQPGPIAEAATASDHRLDVATGVPSIARWADAQAVAVDRAARAPGGEPAGSVGPATASRTRG